MESSQEMRDNLSDKIKSLMSGQPFDAIKNAKLDEDDEEKKLPQDYLKKGKTLLDVLKLVKQKKLTRNKIKTQIGKLLKNEDNLNDFLNSILDVIKNTKKEETKEGMGAASAGGYSQPLFFKETEKVETKEATSSASSGQYATTRFLAKSKKKKDWRGYSDKFRVMPGAKFVKIKDKCKRFPYCNQGDINALKLFENDTLKRTINKISNDMDLHEDIIKEIIYTELVKRQSKWYL